MPGPGGGPSRRSHTKSRKGCKTCKKRHIRCDETMPQCRNCTKHHVVCDYMETTADAPKESTLPTPGPDLLWNTNIQRAVERWRSSGRFPFSELQVHPQPHWNSYSIEQLRLVHHLCSVSRDMIQNGCSQYIIWTEQVPLMLSTAASHPFVMDSILSFAASHLAWITKSTKTRELAFHHGGDALRGLHQAIGSFSKVNADAIFIASVLLSWQATEWRGWNSLMKGTETVVNAMQPWVHESLYTDLIAGHWGRTIHRGADVSGYEMTPEFRLEHIVQLDHAHHFLEQLQSYLQKTDRLRKRIEQLKRYIRYHKTVVHLETPEEHFEHLYTMRKWLFWVPVSVLQSRTKEVASLILVAYLYAVALALEPIFPEVAPAFCSDMALAPLEAIIRDTSEMGATQRRHRIPIPALMEFPQQIATTYRLKLENLLQQGADVPVIQSAPYELEMLNTSLESQIAQYAATRGDSPVFIPSPLQVVGSASASRSGSPYLGLPFPAEMHKHGAAQATHYPVARPSQTFAPVTEVPDENAASFETEYAVSSGFVTTTLELAAKPLTLTASPESLSPERLHPKEKGDVETPDPFEDLTWAFSISTMNRD